MILLLTVLAVTVAFYLGMMISYLVQSREEDHALIRTRGFGLKATVRVYSFEGILLTAMAVVVAPLLGDSAGSCRGNDSALQGPHGRRLSAHSPPDIALHRRRHRRAALSGRGRAPKRADGPWRNTLPEVPRRSSSCRVSAPPLPSRCRAARARRPSLLGASSPRSGCVGRPLRRSGHKRDAPICPRALPDSGRVVVHAPVSPGRGLRRR